jgi:hypothetical protein
MMAIFILLWWVSGSVFVTFFARTCGCEVITRKDALFILFYGLMLGPLALLCFIAVAIQNSAGWWDEPIFKTKSDVE